MEVVEFSVSAEKKSFSSFESLPIELHYKIMSHLTPEELCSSVAPVCRHWRDLANDPVLWQQLKFHGQVHTEETMKKVLDRAPLIRSLEVKNLHNAWGLMPTILGCHLLTELDLSLCGGIDEEFLTLLYESSPRIKSLYLEGCDMDSSAVAVMVGWKNLQHLNLAHCKKITNENIILIAKECVHLEYLNIDGIVHINDCAITVLMEERKNSLKRLYLDGEKLTDFSYEAVTKCNKLVEYGILFAELMSDRGVKAIKELPLLYQLKLIRGSELSNAALKDLFDAGNLCHLTLLNLNSCKNLKDDGLDSLTKCCSKLEMLDLAWCWDLTDRGVETIIIRCRYMKILSLIGLVEITGTCLMSIPETMPDLSFLDLQQCSRIDDDIPTELVQRKPSLRVLNYYGDEFTCS